MPATRSRRCATTLDDYRDATRDPRGTTLFRAGQSHARWLVPFSDTGSWSLYSLGGPPPLHAVPRRTRAVISARGRDGGGRRRDRPCAERAMCEHLLYLRDVPAMAHEHSRRQ